MPDRLHLSRLTALLPIEHRGFFYRVDSLVNQVLVLLRVEERRRRVLADALVGRLALALLAEPGVGLEEAGRLASLVAEAERRVTVAEETTLMQAVELCREAIGSTRRLH